MRMILRAAFDTFTGYGNDGVDMALQFGKMGIDVVPWPTSVIPGLPRAFTDLLTKDAGSAGTDLVVGFGPPQQLNPADFAGLAPTAVGWSMWERTPLTRADMIPGEFTDPESRDRWWGQHPDSIHGRNRDWLDLMVVTCPDNVEAFTALDPRVPYAVAPNGIDPERFPEVERSDDRPYRFFSIGMLNGRKDPFATLKAWELAHEIDPEFDAELILKTSTPGLHPRLMERYKNLTVINEVWAQARVIEFYGQVDCLVSTSRGEGNNKPAMEFMSTGGAVMATDWGGHQNWLHEDSGYPLPGELRPIAEGSEISDFRVDVEATAATFLHIWRNQQEARLKGKRAAQRIRAELSWEKVCDRFLFHVGRVM